MQHKIVELLMWILRIFVVQKSVCTASRIINMICTRPKSNTKVKQRMPYLRERCSIISCLCDLRMQTCINLGFGSMIERILSHQNGKVEFKCIAVVALNIPKNKCHLTPKKFKNGSWGWPSRPPRSDPSRSLRWDVSLKVILPVKLSNLGATSFHLVAHNASLGILRLQCTVLGCKMIWIHYICSSQGIIGGTISSPFLTITIVLRYSSHLKSMSKFIPLLLRHTSV